jgi:hypothetical protein
MSWRENQLRIFTMPIISTAHTSNFTLISNAISNDATVSGTATAALLYLISKPPHWKFNAYDLKRRLNVGLNKVYKVMRELIRAGYATYQRIQSGTIWTIYDTPQNVETATTHAVIDRVNFECVKNECVLERNELLQRNEKTTTPEPIKQPDTVIPVVVSLEEEKPVELKYPEQLKPKQKADIKHHIKKAPIEHRQAILATLAHYLAKGTIYNPIGWIRSQAEGAAKTGTYEPVGAATATKPDTRHIDQTQERLKAARAIKRSSDEKAKGGFQQAKLALRGIL